MKALAIFALLVVLMVAAVGSSGCVRSAAVNAYYAINPDAAPTTAPLPTDVQDPTSVKVPISSAAYNEPEDLRMYRTGGRYLGEYFEVKRDNVTMQKDMDLRIKVYAYKVLYRYTWWSDSWGRYFAQVPETGKKFLVVQVYEEAVGIDSEADGRPWGIDATNFYVQVDGDLISPDTETLPCTRIRELENTWDSQHITGIGYFGYDRRYAGTQGYVCDQRGYLHLGASNAWDGYIVYQIPADEEIEDLYVVGGFSGLGRAYWKLTERSA